MERLCEMLAKRQGQYDAVALSSVIDVPPEYHQGYFDAGGEMVNPWGGVRNAYLLPHSRDHVIKFLDPLL